LNRHSSRMSITHAMLKRGPKTTFADYLTNYIARIAMQLSTCVPGRRHFANLMSTCHARRAQDHSDEEIIAKWKKLSKELAEMQPKLFEKSRRRTEAG